MSALCHLALNHFLFLVCFLAVSTDRKNNILKRESVITASLMGLQFVKDDFSERLAAVGGAVKSVLLDRKSTKNDFVGFY